MSVAPSSETNASTRTPSYFGSKVQPSPGIVVPIDAYIGSSCLARRVTSDPLALLSERAVFAAFDFEADFVWVTSSFRLLRHTLLLPVAISSIVRPVVTDVMFPATMSSSDANSSRCLMNSHCGLSDDEEPSRLYFIRTSAHDPRILSPKKVTLRSPFR
jgi:hypothetical protein